MVLGYFFISVTIIIASAILTAPKTTVVLLEHEGESNAIVVSNEAGSVVLNRPYSVTKLRSAEVEPSQPEPVSEAELRKSYGAVLEAAPEPPLHYILYFEYDRDEPLPESAKMIAEIARSIEKRSPCGVDIIGHTDSVGTREYNMRLSMERTDRVKKLLEGKGVVIHRLNVEHYGESVPLIETDDGVAEPRNRRVEVMVR